MAPPSAIDPPAVTDTEVATFVSSNSINGVMARRQKAPALPRGLAPFATSDMYKGPQSGKPTAKRWDHILSLETISRQPSMLKNTATFLSQPGLISLGGGLPSSEYFPFERLDIKVPSPPGFSEAETKASGVLVSAGKHDIVEGKSAYDLHVALNYGQGVGSAQLLRFITEHTELVHNPPYSDWQCACTVGSTSGLDMAYRMLTERGDFILAEEYTFSTAMETARPMGLRSVGIKMDAEGLLPTHMDQVLAEWDAVARGGRKPRVLYTVPSGQNPTGTTQGEQRRRELYAVCQKHDVFVIEDEPYYFLQMQPYTGRGAPDVPPPASHDDFLRALVPSLLSMDVDGRVMRVDSFSKVISPGTRVGWITASAQIVERYIRHAEYSHQNPSGFSQMVLYKLLEETWGHAGYFDWLIFLRLEYTRRRDVILAACEDYLPGDIATWSPPMAGMFHWIHIAWQKHPQASTLRLVELEERIFLKAAERGVLVVRGSWFRAEGDVGNDLFFRTTYAAASPDQITEAIKRFGETLREEFGSA